MLLDIVKYGDPVLRKKASPVPFVSNDLRALAMDMLDTMYKARGVGLAAEQVGRTEALCVIDVPSDCEETDEARAFNASITQPMVLFNPVILSMEGENRGKEGCLSLPNMSGLVTRAEKVTCQYLDEDGKPQVVTAVGFLARAIQHETDHLKGVLYVDHYTEEEKVASAKKLQKLAKKYGNAV